MDEKNSQNMSRPGSCFVACRPDRTYILTGGLGGFGLALAKWLATKGAKHLLLTSKRGVRTGFQASQLATILDENANVSNTSPQLEAFNLSIDWRHALSRFPVIFCDLLLFCRLSDLG